MDLSQLSFLLGSIESLATVIALIVGGLWAYRRFVRQREDYPHIDFTVDLKFVAVHGDSWIVEIIACLENKGCVQHQISDFDFDLRYLEHSDELQLADRFGGQVLFPHKAAQGSWLPEDWGYTFIEPGIRTHYSYIAALPAQAHIALLHGWFAYRGDREAHTAEKIVPVPIAHVERPPAAAESE